MQAIRAISARTFYVAQKPNTPPPNVVESEMTAKYPAQNMHSQITAKHRSC